MMMCSREEVEQRPYPRVRTRSVTNVTGTGAEFNGDITSTPTAILDHGFLWSLDQTPIFENSDSISLGAGSKGVFSYRVSKNLFPNTNFYVRAYAKSKDYLVYGDIVSFVSLGSLVTFAIDSIYPTNHLMPGNIVTVFGKNFQEGLNVKLNNKILKQINIFEIASSTQFQFQLPDTIDKISSVSIIQHNSQVIAKQSLTAMFSYKNIAGNYVNFYMGVTNTVNSTKDLFGFGWDGQAESTLFTFDQNSNSINAIEQNTISPRFFPVTFSVNGLCYLGGGKKAGTYGISDLDDFWNYSDFYSLDISTGNIIQLQDLPLINKGSDHVVLSFSLNQRGYCFTFAWWDNPTPTNHLFEYDPQNDSWTKRADFPGAARRLSGNNSAPFFFIINGLLYIGGGSGDSDLWTYDPVADAWTQLTLNVTLSDSYYVFNAAGKFYLVDYKRTEDDSSWPQVNFNYLTKFYEFSPSSNTFQLLYSTPIPLNVTGAFTIGSSGFILSGYSIWEFDPTM